MDRKLDELLFALMQNMMLTVSGEKLARDLGVSHSTLVRWIDKLRAAGIEIRGELFTGYRLVRLPDVLLPQLIRPRLRTRILGRNLYHFYGVDSTNLFVWPVDRSRPESLGWDGRHRGVPNRRARPPRTELAFRARSRDLFFHGAFS